MATGSVFTMALLGCFVAGHVTAQSQETCCADLGCFSSDVPFFSFPTRPFHTIPNCNILPKLKLHLSTRQNRDSEILDPYTPDTIAGSTFHLDRDTKILIHGHTDNFNWPWWKDMKDELLAEGDFNVIRVDWSAGNTPPYIQAVSNARLVGAYVAKLIQHLEETVRYDPLKIHIIGHGLGAHTAGYVGERISQIGRITGLDPTGPLFTGTDTSVRLDPSDAKAVDTIVTDGQDILALGNMSLGSTDAMGHMNFYPNGGANQPGCEKRISSVLWNGPSANTSHFKTINSKKCVMKAFECDSNEQFLRGDCFSCKGHKCSLMGLHADVRLVEPYQTKKFYLQTTDRPPFCTRPYKFQFKVANNGDKPERGWIYVTIYGSHQKGERFSVNSEVAEFVPGQEYNFVTALAGDLGRIQSAIFQWVGESGSLLSIPLQWLRPRHIVIDGDFVVTDCSGVATTLRPTTETMEEKKDVLAVLLLE